MFYSEFAEDYEQIFPFKNKVYSFLKENIPSSEGTVLDVGCATGHYCGRFAAEGYRAAGIDLDPEMIAAARERYPGPDFRVLDLVDLGLVTGKYGLIFSIGNVMAHVSLPNFLTFLDSLRQKLAERGVWIFQVINWNYILEKKDFFFPVIETEDRLFIRSYTDITSDKLVFNTVLKDKLTGEIVFKDNVTMYPVSSGEYISLHRKAGFELAGHYSDFGKSPYMDDVFSADIYVFKL